MRRPATVQIDAILHMPDAPHAQTEHPCNDTATFAFHYARLYRPGRRRATARDVWTRDACNVGVLVLGHSRDGIHKNRSHTRKERIGVLDTEYADVKRIEEAHFGCVRCARRLGCSCRQAGRRQKVDCKLVANSRSSLISSCEMSLCRASSRTSCAGTARGARCAAWWALVPRWASQAAMRRGQCTVRLHAGATFGLARVFQTLSSTVNRRLCGLPVHMPDCDALNVCSLCGC